MNSSRTNLRKKSIRNSNSRLEASALKRSGKHTNKNDKAHQEDTHIHSVPAQTKGATNRKKKAKTPQASSSSNGPAQQSRFPVLKIVKGDLNNPPKVIKEFLGVLPHEPVSYSIKKRMIFREGPAEPLCVCKLNHETILLDDHMVLDIITKHNVQDFYLQYIDSVNSISAGIWWIIEHSNSFRHYTEFVRVETCLTGEPNLKTLAKENQRLGGKMKGNLSKLNKPFEPIDCLAIIAQKSGTSRQLVADVKYILKHGTPAEIEKCRKGKATITAMRKILKGKLQDSEDYQKEHNAGYDNVYYQNPAEGTYRNKIVQGNVIEKLREMQFNGVQDLTALVTSIPYNVGTDYGPTCCDDIPYDEFIDFIGQTIYEAQKLGRNGMRICINCALIANRRQTKNSDYRHSIFADLRYKIKELNNKYEDCNLLFWGHFNWFKNHAGGKVCQGSMSSSSPVLRSDSEYIAVWVKNTKKLVDIHRDDRNSHRKDIFSPSERDKYIITSEEYCKFTLQTWQIRPVTDHEYRHLARFPEEVPYRLIKLFTNPMDTVLDCFCGSGTTCKVAKMLKRNYIGIDLVHGYCQMSKERCEEVA